LIPDEAAPYLRLAMADTLWGQPQSIKRVLRDYSEDQLYGIATHVIRHEVDCWWLAQCIQFEESGSLAEVGPSWWVTDVLPAIKAELDRRAKPKREYGSNSPLAQLKALDLATVAGKYTELQPAGPGKLKGRCPLHQERTPSFYIYEDSQRWRCYGACARGGDVVELLSSLKAVAA
jgi:hypothetical protein